MRPISIKLMSVIGLMVTLLIFTGCGDSDLLDEPTTRYHASVVTEDNGATTTNIDVIQTADCDGDPATVDPEPFTQWDAQVTIESDTTGDIFNVESYTVTFRPNHGSTDVNVAIDAADMPVLGGTLNPISHSIALLVRPGTSATIDLPVWTASDKRVYLDVIASSPNVGDVLSTSLSYDIQVVLNCRTADDETFRITTPWAPLDFAGYNNC